MPDNAKPASTASSAQPSTQESLEGFRSDVGGGNTTSAEGILVAAYLVFWVLAFGFIATTWRRYRQVSSRLDALEADLESGPERG